MDGNRRYSKKKTSHNDVQNAASDNSMATVVMVVVARSELS